MVIFAALAFPEGGAIAQLPDRRGYEQVSPPEMNAADVIPNETRVHASAAGGKVIFASLAGFGDVVGVGVSSEYLAVRGPGGRWSTHAISPVQDPTGYFAIFAQLEPLYLAVAPDLSRGVLRTRSPLTDAPDVAQAANLYRREDLLSAGAGTWTLLTDSPGPQVASRFGGFFKPEVAAATGDFSRVLFESQRNLTVDAPPQSAPSCLAALAGGAPSGAAACDPRLYEFVAGETRLVGVLPRSEGGAAAPSAQAGQGARRANITAGTLSQDGTRVVFTVPVSSNAADGVLYLRDDHGTLGVGDDDSIRVNASERTDCSGDSNCGGDELPDPAPDPLGSQPATYWAASADASQVFFTSAEQLTDDDLNATSDVYRFDLGAAPGHRLTRLSVDEEPDDGLEPACDGVLGASADGRYVYFVTTGDQLVDGGPTGDTGGPTGGKRIYVWRDGVVREVGAVNGGDETKGLLGQGGAVRTSRVSRDGARLAFITQGTGELLSLFGHPAYDHGTGCHEGVGPSCNEVYVYDASARGGAGDLLCASCNPTGAPATADARFVGSRVGLGLTAEPPYLNRTLTDDGRFVFFNTAERLVPGDRNAAVDAYELDVASGEVQLISTGQGAEDALFLDASADGRDVFFVTRERLRSSDTDESLDLYDARIDGAPDPVPAERPACEGEACKPPSSARAPRPLPPSMTSDGPGDALAAPGPPAVFSVEPLRARQRRALARRGRTAVIVLVARPGRIALVLSARIGTRTRPPRAVARVERRLRRAGRVRVPIGLSAAARRELVRRGRLRLRLTTTYSQSPVPERMTIVLAAP